MFIYKYPFEVSDTVEIMMPTKARILTVQTQSNAPCIWALVDGDKPLETRRFRVFGTGHEFNIDPIQSKYIGTFQLMDGGFIGHLFEPAYD
ncbi:hypothetical protein LCGC14_0861460 [marine sediment metagenome]|uniref:DUF7352 domain-containing protein n=1 Tax=marine sediment metagenome TaxID=412755 RepID=A0A0F9PSP2_9ZZZZ